MSPSAFDKDCPRPEHVAAFLSGDLDAAALRAFDAHVDDCTPCRELLAALARGEGAGDSVPALVVSPSLASAASPSPASPSPSAPSIADDAALSPGERVGRYRVLDRLGAGGMAIVYAAYDPELQRRVALKLLRRDGGDLGEPTARRDRLIAEAQAMAQLAHPNVVAVHDVGSHGGHIFIAMELVHGQTLAEWLATAPRRGWREVLAAFVPAGLGLAAAHAAGLVHRDFKPENVLVGDDGRVRVTDFGLARASLPVARAASSPSPNGSAGARRLTVTGSLVGTPFYMAPEQFLGQPADARSDQFSFCVALHVALTGAHPFAGDGLADLADAVTDGKLRPPPRHETLPRWLRRVLQRGLSLTPAARYPSMGELLTALQRNPRRRGWLAAAAAMLLVTIIGGGLGYRRHSALLACRAAGRKVERVWSPSRAIVIERAFAASGHPSAAAAFAATARTLDAYARRWSTLATAACATVRPGDPLPYDLADPRALCLDAHLRDALALSDRFASADASLVERAPGLAEALGDLGDCTDGPTLAACGRTSNEFDWCDVVHEGKGEPAQDDGLTRFRGRTLQLRAKRYLGDDQGNIARNYQLGDQVWVDVSTDRGRSWLRCGPFTGDRTLWIPHRGKWLRACIRADDVTQCATNGNELGPDGSRWWSYADRGCQSAD